jgi:AraC-like DNA-binding protein
VLFDEPLPFLLRRRFGSIAGYPADGPGAHRHTPAIRLVKPSALLLRAPPSMQESGTRDVTRACDKRFADELHRFAGCCQAFAGAVHFGSSADARRALGEIAGAFPEPATHTHVLILKSVLVKFAAGARRLPRAPATSRPSRLMSARTAIEDTRLALARAEIARHCVTPAFDPRTIAENLGVSLAHLKRLLKREGEPLRDLVTRTRLQRSRTLLAVTHLTVKEIAAACGYHTTGQLDRTFRRHLGATPIEWRKQARIAEQYRSENGF